MTHTKHMAHGKRRPKVGVFYESQKKCYMGEEGRPVFLLPLHSRCCMAGEQTKGTGRHMAKREKQREGKQEKGFWNLPLTIRTENK